MTWCATGPWSGLASADDPWRWSPGRPTLANVIPGRWDITDWSLASGASGNLEDPAFAAMVGAQVGDALDLLHDGAARVVVTTVPLTGPG